MAPAEQLDESVTMTSWRIETSDQMGPTNLRGDLVDGLDFLLWLLTGRSRH